MFSRHIIRQYKFICVLLAVFTLAACGQKGDLYLPGENELVNSPGNHSSKN